MINPIEPFFAIPKPEQSERGNRLVCSWMWDFSAPSFPLKILISGLILVSEAGAAPLTSRCWDREWGWGVVTWLSGLGIVTRLLGALCKRSQRIPREPSWAEEAVGAPGVAGSGARSGGQR